MNTIIGILFVLITIVGGMIVMEIAIQKRDGM